MALKFTNLVKTVILEQGRYELLRDRFTKPKKKDDKVIPPRMSLEKFDELVLADPTTRRDGDKVKKAGTYVQWLLKQYNKLNQKAQENAEYGTPAYKGELTSMQNMFFEDLYKTTEDLEKFDRFKRQIDTEDRDINKHGIDSLFELVKDFSLEKTKGTKEDKKEAAKTFDYPGSEPVYKGSEWSVVRIDDQGQVGKDAACFFGGYNQETRWCTSAPGLSYFNTYIKQGPLYVVLKNSDESAEKTGLPKERYQFHFPSNQFMDINDRQIDLVNFLITNPELKEVFKPEFAKGMTSMDGKKVNIDYPRDAASKYIALYGFDELFQNLPKDVTSFDFTKSSGGYRGNDVKELAMDIPEQLGDYKNLMALHFEGILKSLPKSLGKLRNLQFLSIPNNPNLKTIPEEIAQLPNLKVINIQGNSQLKLPEAVEKLAEEGVFISR